jgi:hypothetical protein
MAMPWSCFSQSEAFRNQDIAGRGDDRKALPVYVVEGDLLACCPSPFVRLQRLEGNETRAASSRL